MTDKQRHARLVVALAGVLALVFPGSPVEAETPSQRVIVTFAPGTGLSEQRTSTERAGRTKRRVDERRVAVEVDSNGRRSLEQSPRVVSVVPDVRIRAVRVPNDPCFSSCPYGSQWHLPEVNAPAAWDVTTGSSSVTVAVLDTGIKASHPDLQGRVLFSKQFSDSPTIDDLDGHGTAVAGVAAAVGNNGIGVAGVGWDLRLISYKALDDNGNGYVSDMAAAIRTAAADGAAVINVSASSPEDPGGTLGSAVSYANARNATVVAAAGNYDGVGSPPPAYPAAYPEVLAVAATDRDRSRAYFSAYGPAVDIAAPGVNVLTTSLGASPYAAWSGTSFSAPIVSGAAALIRSTPQGTSANFVRSRLLGTARPLGSGMGSGLLDAGAALQGLGACAEVPGYLLDGYGGLHPRGGAGPATGSPYWRGWDIARDVAGRPGTSSGWVLDGFGGVHPFNGAPAVAVSGYWPGWDIAKAATANPTGPGGWVLDGYGGVHPFGGAPPVAVSGYWAGWNIARDVVANPTGPGGWVLDGYGGVHPFGGAPPVAVSGYWPGWDIARKLVANPGGPGGWVLDGYGGMHPFGGAPPAAPTPGYPLRPARDAAVRSGVGQVVSGQGHVAVLGTGCLTAPVWPGWDIARAFAPTG